MGSLLSWIGTAVISSIISDANIPPLPIIGQSPKVTVTSLIKNKTNLTKIPIQFNFSKPVIGFTASSIQVTNGEIKNLTGAGKHYVAELILRNNGITPLSTNFISPFTTTVYIPENVVRSFKGKGNRSLKEIFSIIVTPIGYYSQEIKGEIAAKKQEVIQGVTKKLTPASNYRKILYAGDINSKIIILILKEDVLFSRSIGLTVEPNASTKSLATSLSRDFPKSSIYEVHLENQSDQTQLDVENSIRKLVFATQFLVNYFKAQEKRVYIIAKSYGSFVALNHMNIYRNSADKLALIGGRMDFPQSGVEAYKLGCSVSFSNTDFITLEQKDCTNSPSLGKSTLVTPRYSEIIKDLDLRNLLFISADQDTIMGKLSIKEQGDLEQRGAHIFRTQENHQSLMSLDANGEAYPTLVEFLKVDLLTNN